MKLLIKIEDFFMLMYYNFRTVFPFLIAAIIFVGVYAYYKLKSVEVTEERETPAHWEACDSVYRMIDYLSEIAKKRKKAIDKNKRNQIIPPDMRVSNSRGKICYPDLINPFKYVTPRVPIASLYQP